MKKNKLFIVAFLGLAMNFSQADVADSIEKNISSKEQVAQTRQNNTQEIEALFKKLDAAALANHPNAKVSDSSLKRKGSVYSYKTKLTDDQGVQWKIQINAADGTVINEKSKAPKNKSKESNSIAK
ncbi:PepSY domain-containing protein [Candidatus Nitrosacidococcus tergens]|uniref:PepSY domain-containing protein n=1 Tax=Candidatus Nitrosacidococcus tergens TaxID=553981 RepID=A0A7G1QA94_9GAMM|nr:PepSY domain-containing protein [Candidatus Nitrosacidococcus tergens]CAB1276380.1 conserved exported protein of unknown function [Candidatus Nitrosacidococcus tergens]